MTIRLATVGTGAVTRELSSAVSVVEGIEVTCVYSRDRSRALALARDLGAEAVETDFDALLRSDVDAVYIASPNSLHFAQARAALRHGMHVLVEKPGAGSENEWNELVRLAQSVGRVVLEGVRTRFDPGLGSVRDVLPLLGPIRNVSFSYQKVSSQYARVRAGQHVNVFDPAMGGGALADLGIYVAHALIFLFGPPRGVQAAQVRLDTGVDGVGMMLAEYEGFLAHLAFSKISSSQRPSEIQGEEATLLIDNIASPRRLTLMRPGREGHVVNVDAPRHMLSPVVERFASLVTGHESALDDNLHTGLALRLMDHARASTSWRGFDRQ